MYILPRRDRQTDIHVCSTGLPHAFESLTNGIPHLLRTGAGYRPTDNRYNLTEFPALCLHEMRRRVLALGAQGLHWSCVYPGIVMIVHTYPPDVPQDARSSLPPAPDSPDQRTDP